MMKPVKRPELGMLSAYNRTMLRVMIQDMQHELAELDDDPSSRSAAAVVRSQIKQVENELKRRRRALVLPIWLFESGMVR